MLTDFLYVVGSGLALFLLGANLAFLWTLGTKLASWFIFKIMAWAFILGYMSLSLFYGDPGVYRASLGFVALFIDVFALSWMWWSIEKLRATGVKGMIPIAKLDGE